MIVEFIGGPLDGEVLDIGDRREWRIVRPRSRGVEWIAEGDVRVPSSPPPLDEGIYRADPTASCFAPELYWQGWNP